MDHTPSSDRGGPLGVVPAPPTTDVRARRRWPRLLWPVALAIASAAPAADVTMTRYVYNADGAVTAVTRHTGGGGAPPPTYFTWANFVPDPQDPARGLTRAADGNLVAIGPRPGASLGNDTFTYDQRDRLVACAVAGSPGVAHRYHPASLLAASSLGAGAERRFYYGNGEAPEVANLLQPEDGAAASFLGPVYLLDDGSQQVLLTPRKDSAAVYQPATGAVTPYAYDPYGGEAGVPAADCYDLASNPFRYAGEYRDPICSIDYLRSRWYLAAAPTFLSRDRLEKLQRYGYTGGNPVNRIDPTGRSYRSFSVATGGFFHRLGVGGLALSLLPGLGELSFALQLSANAGPYFHDPANVALFGAGILAELALPAEALRDVGTGATLGRGGRFALEGLVGSGAFQARTAIDGALGGAQAVLAGVGGDRHQRFDLAAFGESAGATAATLLTGRAVLGFGYRPHGNDAETVDALAVDDHAKRELRQEHAHGAGRAQRKQLLVDNFGRANQALIYRVRIRNSRSLGIDSPLLDLFDAGPYHEAVAAVTVKGVRASEAFPGYAYTAVASDEPRALPFVLVTRAKDALPADAGYVFVGTGVRGRAMGRLESRPGWMASVARRSSRVRADEIIESIMGQR